MLNVILYQLAAGWFGFIEVAVLLTTNWCGQVGSTNYKDSGGGKISSIGGLYKGSKLIKFGYGLGYSLEYGLGWGKYLFVKTTYELMHYENTFD